MLSDAPKARLSPQLNPRSPQKRPSHQTHAEVFVHFRILLRSTSFKRAKFKCGCRGNSLFASHLIWWNVIGRRYASTGYELCLSIHKNDSEYRFAINKLLDHLYLKNVGGSLYYRASLPLTPPSTATLVLWKSRLESGMALCCLQWWE